MKRHGKKQVERTEPDLSEIIPAAYVDPIVVPERLCLPITPDDDEEAATEEMIDAQQLNADIQTFNNILNA